MLGVNSRFGNLPKRSTYAPS